MIEKPLWECPDCGRRMRSEPAYYDDWPDGKAYGVGPDCPMCKAEMWPVKEVSHDR